MRADHWLVLTAAVCLVVGGAPRPTSQSALTKVRPLVARITPHSDVELLDLSTGRVRLLYKRSQWFSKDVSVSPDGRHVAFVQFDPGIEGGINVRLSQEVGLAILDTAGSIVYRIDAGVVRYAWCGPMCVAYLRGGSDESDQGFHVTGAGIVDISTGAVEPLPGPPWPHALAYASFDSSIYLVYSTAAGEPELRRFDSSSHDVLPSSHKGMSFSEDGRFYLSYSDSPRLRRRLYETQTDEEITTPDLESIGVAERWLPSGGSHLLVRKVAPIRPPTPPSATPKVVLLP